MRENLKKAFPKKNISVEFDAFAELQILQRAVHEIGQKLCRRFAVRVAHSVVRGVARDPLVQKRPADVLQRLFPRVHFSRGDLGVKVVVQVF